MFFGLKAGYILAALTLILLWSAPASSQSEIKIFAVEETRSDFSEVPCKAQDRPQAVKTLFEKMGAAPSDILVDKYGNVENIIVRKQGTTGETIVIGAHYDKVADGCGAVDNWTGIVTVARLYGSLKDYQSRKTILLVAFGKEEGGLIGSSAMVRAIKKVNLGQYCAMINIDSLGLSGPQVMDNASTKKLRILVGELAKEMNMPFAHAAIGGADADSSSFAARKIPAVTIHGMTNDWRKILHTRKDQASQINPDSVYQGYRLALALTQRLDGMACDAVRDEKK
jgi:Zn-dependent M28 family amino/carboxypeptidase